MHSTDSYPDAYRLTSSLGPRLVLEKHPEACGLEDLPSLLRHQSKAPTAVDLFSGAGGLSLGLQRAGYQVVMGVDHNLSSVETHHAYFPGASVFRDIATEDVIEEILEPLRGANVDLLAGGPPCQPFSKANRWRRAAHHKGHGSLRDHRRELWQSFLFAASVLKPKAILIENVPDIASNEDGIILRSIFARLESLGYSFDARAFYAYDFGVAQYRQRIFVVGFRDARRRFVWPSILKPSERSTLADAISDLPALVGGWTEEAGTYGGPRTALQRRLRGAMASSELFDHVTRAVRKDDLEAFTLMNSKTRYDQLPEELRRYSSDSFNDKYNRLDWNTPARTITAHIAKDGYWYIHPEQHRSISIREAARIQSFPDWFRFSGARTSALRQIGEAVAPFVGEALGFAVLEFTGQEQRAQHRLSPSLRSSSLRHTLETAYEEHLGPNSAAPWRMTTSLWHNLLGETLFSERRMRSKVHLYWGNLASDWLTPALFLKDKFRTPHLQTMDLAGCIGPLNLAARYLQSAKAPSIADLVECGLNERVVRRAMAFSGISYERPNDSALIRVANRVFGYPHEREPNHIESQIATAMLVGRDTGATAYSAAIELGENFCTSRVPACLICPLMKECDFAISELAA